MTLTIPETPKVQQMLLSFPRFVWNSSSTQLYFFFNSSEVFLWFNWRFSLVQLKVSFDFTKMPSPQRCYGEPSPSQRRALAVSMTSLRQLVEFKGALQLVCGRRWKKTKKWRAAPSNSPKGEGRTWSVKCEAWSEDIRMEKPMAFFDTWRQTVCLIDGYSFKKQMNKKNSWNLPLVHGFFVFLQTTIEWILQKIEEKS